MADTEKIVICPACEQMMTKVVLENGNFFIDVCTEGCGGIWLDNRELNQIDDEDENIDEINDALNNKSFKPVDRELIRFCPTCNVALVKNFISPEQKIEIDECYTCGGKFLDYKELDEIRQLDKNLSPSIDVAEMESIFKNLLEKDGAK